MLDLVKQETERIDSRFLEPACGDGNFLAEVLRRKLAVVKKKYQKSPPDYEKYSVLSVCNIYGVELLSDNASDCRERLFNIWNEEYTANCKKEVNPECREAVRFILERNILCGNALTLKTNENNPIIFSEWSLVNESLLKRRDFRLDEMLEGRQNQQKTFFMQEEGWEYDREIKSFIPTPIKEFPLTDYWKVQHYGD